MCKGNWRRLHAGYEEAFNAEVLKATSVWEVSYMYEVSSVNTFNNHDPGAVYP